LVCFLCHAGHHAVQLSATTLRYWSHDASCTCKHVQTVHSVHALGQSSAPVQVFTPQELPTLEQLYVAHDCEYVQQFLAACLPDAIERRIGFREVVRDRVLIERTLWEVAGACAACSSACERWQTRGPVVLVSVRRLSNRQQHGIMMPGTQAASREVACRNDACSRLGSGARRFL
jgi:hypothetical protein